MVCDCVVGEDDIGVIVVFVVVEVLLLCGVCLVELI